MGTLHVLNSSGDTETRWSPENATQVKETEELFHSLLEKGYRGFTSSPSGGSTRMDKFDASQESVYMIPQLQGG